MSHNQTTLGGLVADLEFGFEAEVFGSVT